MAVSVQRISQALMNALANTTELQNMALQDENINDALVDAYEVEKNELDSLIKALITDGNEVMH